MTASGNFSSTRFPATYPSDASKAWIIDSRARVELTFDVFSLQSCRDCSCDYVEVRDGPSFMSPLIGRFCGNRTEPIRVVSSDAYLFVYFKTDSSVSGRGYNARYAHTTSKLVCLLLIFDIPVASLAGAKKGRKQGTFLLWCFAFVSPASLSLPLPSPVAFATQANVPEIMKENRG